MGYMTTDEFTIDSGLLDVGDGHQIWWHDWGFIHAKSPILHLHGGPGSGSKNRYKLSYDPSVQRVIFFDQRGSGQSLPFGSTDHNTTQNLIADIEHIREKFGLEKFMLSGHSWGSTLALAYAIAHPTHVSKMLLGGIFLGTKQDADYIQQGGLKTHFPEAWEQYIEVVPEERRGDTVSFYLEHLNKGAEASKDYLRRWLLLEGSASGFDVDYAKDLAESYDYDDSARPLALLEAHYFQNNCFMPEEYIMKNAAKLKDIPTVIVQGRQDHICPPEAAFNVAKAMGKNCHLHIVPGGHSKDLVTREVTYAYCYSFLKD